MVSAASTSAPYQVLVIENSPEYALQMQRWLEEDGNTRVTHVTNGAEGVRLAATRAWDLLITDVELASMDGLDLLSMVKAGARWTPVLVVTAHESIEYAHKALRKRADALLFKPFVKDDFLSTSHELVADAATRRRREQKLVLAIGAHPDDVEIGCGGALDKHRGEGDTVVILTLSEGMSGGNGSTRTAEARHAAVLLGAQLHWGGLRDTTIPEGAQTIAVIEEVVRRWHPTHVYTHSLNDSHQDHRSTHHATIVAARHVPNVYCYQAPSTMVEFHPRLFIDISQHMDAKLRTLAAYGSQTTHRAYLQEDLIRATARYWGRFAGYVLAEPMEVVRQRGT